MDCESVVVDIMKLAALRPQSRISVSALAQVLRGHADYSSFSEWLGTVRSPPGAVGDALNRNAIMRLVRDYSKQQPSTRAIPRKAVAKPLGEERSSDAALTSKNAMQSIAGSPRAVPATKQHSPVGGGGLANLVVRNPSRPSSSARGTLLAQAGNLVGRLEALLPRLADDVQEVSQLSRAEIPTDIGAFASDVSALAGRVQRLADQAERVRHQLSTIAAPAARANTARQSEWPSDVDLAFPAHVPARPKLAPHAAARSGTAASHGNGAGTLGVGLSARPNPLKPSPRSKPSQPELKPVLQCAQNQENELGLRVPRWQGSRPKAYVAPKAAKAEKASDDGNVLTNLGNSFLKEWNSTLEEFGQSWGFSSGWA